MFVDGILLLYHHPILLADAQTVRDNVSSLAQCSRFRVWDVNTALGMPRGLRDLEFSVVVLHYSLFAYPYTAFTPQAFFEYLGRLRRSYKVAFFQDEYHHCKARFAFLNDYNVDCVYTLVLDRDFDKIYRKYTRVPTLVNHIPGYVSDDCLAAAQRFALPVDQRTIDVGYRGRKLPPYMGRGSREKYTIGPEFKRRAAGLGLELDIEVDERHRIYGEKWYKFLGNCKACLGVEAGVSVFDIEDVALEQYNTLIAANPHTDLDDLREPIQKILEPWEDYIFHRVISPRHFEAAAFRICQILFEGHYSGIMKPRVHYIPLKKDFSNFDDVIRMLSDRSLCDEVRSNAHRDLIASGDHTYACFMQSFDRRLLEAGLSPDCDEALAARVTSALRTGHGWRKFKTAVKELRRINFPGRGAIKSAVNAVFRPRPRGRPKKKKAPKNSNCSR